ncbi:hypothetical protein Tco_1351640 [Tanacetum coccineum]
MSSGVKEKQVSLVDTSVEGTKHVNVVNAGLESFPTVFEALEIQSSISNEENMNDVGTMVGPILAGLSSYPPLPRHGSTPAGNNPGMSSYANVTGEPRRKALNFHTLFTLGVNELPPLGIPADRILKNLLDRVSQLHWPFSIPERLKADNTI